MNNHIRLSSLRFLVVVFFVFRAESVQAAVYKVLLGNQKNAPSCRQDVRLNDVNRCLVETSLLGHSGYQTDRKKDFDQSKIAFHFWSRDEIINSLSRGNHSIIKLIIPNTNTNLGDWAVCFYCNHLCILKTRGTYEVWYFGKQENCP